MDSNLDSKNDHIGQLTILVKGLIDDGLDTVAEDINDVNTKIHNEELKSVEYRTKLEQVIKDIASIKQEIKQLEKELNAIISDTKTELATLRTKILLYASFGTGIITILINIAIVLLKK